MEEELDKVFKGGYILEKELLNNGYTNEVCVGTCSCVNDEKFVRYMDFEYTDLNNKNKPTQEFLDSITPKGFKFVIENEDSYDEYFTIGISLE